jgi:hypothetical protein
MPRRFAIAVALLAGLAVALWVLRDSTPSAAPPVVIEAERPPPRAALPADPGARAEPLAGVAQNEPAPAGTLGGASAVAGDSPTAELAQALAQRAYDNFGSRLVGYLARQGLSRSDAEPIVTEMLRETVSCTLDALREQALEQRVDFTQVHSALDAELYDTDGPLLTAILDVTAAAERAMPCSMTALTQAGIPPQAASELLPGPRR